MFKSTDSGATWTAANSGLTKPEVDTLAVDRENPNRLIAGGAGGVYEINFAQ